MTITAAVDGSSLGNPGPGGWAWVVSDDCWDAGGWDEATNNRGELTAILELLRATADAGLADEPLHVQADSQYAINVVSKWRHGWKKRGWTKADKKPIANLELIQEIDTAITGRTVSFEWVRGHNGHPLNERADDLARGAAEIHRDGGTATGGPGFTHGRSATGVPSTPSQPTGTDATHVPTDGRGAPTGPHTEATGGGGSTPTAADAAPTSALDARGTGDAPEARVTAAEREFLRAWATGDEATLDRLAADGCRRVWPNGTVTATLAGRAPADLSVSPLTVTAAGSGAWLATSYVRLGETLTVATSLWVEEGDALRLLHHQATPVTHD